MRKNIFLLVIAVFAFSITVSAQVSYKAAPERNAKATLAMLTLHTELNEAAFGSMGSILTDYYRDITATHNDHALSAELVKSRSDQSEKTLNEKLQTILTKEQMEIWTGSIQPDIEKQLLEN